MSICCSLGPCVGKRREVSSVIIRPLAVLLLSATADLALQPGRHTVKCRFEVKCDASPGTRIWIVGNDPALGSWDVDSGKALLLQRSEGNIWTGDLSVEWEQWDYYSPRLLAFKVRPLDGCRLQRAGVWCSAVLCVLTAGQAPP